MDTLCLNTEKSQWDGEANWAQSNGIRALNGPVTAEQRG